MLAGPRTAPPGARRNARATADGSAPGGAAPFAATRFDVAVQLDRTVNASNDVGETALHPAAYQGRNSVVQFLVEKGANLNAKTLAGNTPLVVAEGGVYHSGEYHPHPSTAELIRTLMAGR